MVKRLVRAARAQKLDGVFHALADTTRRSILRALAGGERTVTEIATPYGMSLAAVSKHLKVLEGVQLIRREKRGSFHLIRINAAPMKEASQWLSYYEEFWNAQLDRMEAAFQQRKQS